MSRAVDSIRQLWRACKFNRISFTLALLRHCFYRLQGRNLLTGSVVQLLGARRIAIDGMLKIGLSEVGFVDGCDRTLVRVRGRINVVGKFAIAQGCRIDVGPNALFEVRSGYINPFTKIILSHGLSVGDGCAISWGCQFVDDDFHLMNEAEINRLTGKRIVIGDRVWIGADAIVLAGSVIPSGCVVAAGSIVRSVFTDENCLIAGSPARVIRRGVSWS